MPPYQHTQIGYLMICVTLAVAALFGWVQITTRTEIPLPESGANLVITATMTLIVFILASFSTLNVLIDGSCIKIRFGWGVFRKTFSLNEIKSVQKVKNHWRYGFGIRFVFWPKKMWIYNVSGFDAVELMMKNGKLYRIGTDEPEKLETAIRRMILA